VASGGRRVDVAYVKPGGAIFHRVLGITPGNFIPGVGASGITYNSEISLGGDPAIDTPVLTCSTYHQPELFVRGTDHRIRHNHFLYAPAGAAPFTIEGVTLNLGWQGWSYLPVNYFTSALKTDGKVFKFAAAGTRTGKTELVARAYDSSSSQAGLIFHNEFESGRYGRCCNTPLKTVHWRGWEMTAERAFLGGPALVAIDQNFQMAHAVDSPGYGPTVLLERLAQTNATTSYAQTSNIRVLGSPVDPIALSTGPGVFDSITLGSDGKPEHRRYYNSPLTPVSPTRLVKPANVSLTAFSAVSYGNDFIDLAARGGDNRIYLWRYRDGVWSQPTGHLRADPDTYRSGTTRTFRRGSGLPPVSLAIC
jgi:hypothetical protein